MILFALLLLVGISVGFSGLARKHGRSQLLYALIGMIVFILSMLAFDAVIVLIFHVRLDFIMFASYPVGLLGCWLLFVRLRSSWSNANTINTSGSLDDDLLKKETEQ